MPDRLIHRSFSLALPCLLSLLIQMPTYAEQANTEQATSKAKIHQGIINDYKPKQIAKHTYVIHGPLEMPNVENQGFMNNPGFIIADKSVIVVDPGSTVQIGRAVLHHIRQLTDKPISHIFSSHVHGDHWLANHAFVEDNKDVLTYAHPLMIEMANKGEDKVWLGIMKSSTQGGSEGTQAIIPTQALTDKQDIKVGNITIRAHLTEWAHSKTDAMIEVVEDKVLFTGDNAMSGRIARMDDGQFKGNIAAMNRMLALDIEKIVPGHGPTGDKSILSYFRDYLQTVYNAAEKGLEDDLEDYEIKDDVLTSLRHYHNWSGLNEQLGRHLGLAMREAEDF